MISLPKGLDMPAAETSAFAVSRGLKGYSRSWTDLASHAQLVMTYFQELDASDTSKLHDITVSAPLVAASRILDAISTANSELTPTQRDAWSLLAMLSFGMWGNFLSASAVRFRISPQSLNAPITAAIVATCTPHLAHDILPKVVSSPLAVDYVQGLLKFLRSGKHSDASALERKLIACLPEADSFESAMLRSVRIVLRQVIVLGSLRTIPALLPNLGQSYASQLFDSCIRVLLPPQFRAITQANLITRRENSLVALHTSAGKTLLGELCLLRSLDPGPGVAVYIAPYVALGRQVAEKLNAHAPDLIRVHTMVGGFHSDRSLDPMIHRELVVATPERFDFILRNQPELLENLRCVVIDEAHHISNGLRGVRLEGITARLRLAQQRGVSVRIVLLSAVTNSYARLQQWLDIPDEAVVTDSWRPTARRLAIWERDGEIRWYRGSDVVRPTKSSNQDLLGTRLVPWPKVNFYVGTHFGATRKQQPDAMENAAALAEYFWKEFNDVCLCVCMTKDSTRRLAWQLAVRFPVVTPLPATVAALVELIGTSMRHLNLLGQCLRRGIAYHNASLPHEIRHGIEDAVNNRELRVVTATTTLAEGVDLPFRTTILVDWLVWHGEKHQAPISPLLFRNIAGRCGRAGRQTEGDTIVFDNPVGDAALTFAPARLALQKDIFFADNAVEMTSPFEESIVGSQDDLDLKNALASQFLASIPENPDEESMVEAFVQALYWSKNPSATNRARTTIREIADLILDPDQGALAVAASPFQLTEFGAIAARTGFAPSSCRAILRHFREHEDSEDDFHTIAAMIVELGDFPEQPDRKWRKEVKKRSKACRVKVEDVPVVVGQWLAGVSLLEIFVNLPTVKKSQSSVKIADWLEGMSEPVVWDEEFDKFSDWVDHVLVSFASWLFRASASLSALTGGWSASVNWTQLSEFCQLGVNTPWAVAAIRARAPASREVVAVLGKLFVDWSTPADPLGLAMFRRVQRRGRLDDLIQKLHEVFPEEPHTNSALRVLEWVLDQV